ncbi:MAG: ATP-binding protein [Crocosphaera sp.]|nr:ATP-binding protein [Crocosphaera sp.]
MTDFKILLIEDETHWQDILQEDIQEAVKEMPKENSLTLTIQDTLDKGRQVLESENSWNLIVTDLVLPSPSGMEARELLEQTKQLDIPTIVISERETSKAIWDQLAENGVGDFFPKADYSNRIHEFVNRVKQILTGRTSNVPINQDWNEFQTIWKRAENALEQKQFEMFQTETDNMFQTETDKLTALLCRKLSLIPLEDSATHEWIYGRMIDASPLGFKLKIRQKFPVIYGYDQNGDQDNINQIRSLLQKFKIYARYFALLVSFGNGEHLQEQLHKSHAKNDFIVLDHDKFWDIISAPSPLQELTRYILKQIDLVTVSPYTWSGPVPKEMFYDREEQLKTITENISKTNYALLANRKMGKTSLLNKIFPQLKNDPEKQVFYFDLQAVNDYDSFYEYLAYKSQDFAKEIAQLDQRSPLSFNQVIKNIQQSYQAKQIILIFDEVDELLAYDLKFQEQLFKTFRALSQDNTDDSLKVRFIFSGTTTLVKQMINPDSPLFSFFHPLPLEILDQRSAQDLITVPMENLGVDFENEETSVQRILSITAQHPNLIQKFCGLLIDTINKTQVRIITEEDVETVINSEEFYDYAERLIWGQSKAIDKLLVYVMWSYPQFTELDVIKEFRKRGLDIQGITNSLETLKIYTALTQNGKRDEKEIYTFTFREFAKLIEKRNNIENLIGIYQQEVGGSK